MGTWPAQERPEPRGLCFIVMTPRTPRSPAVSLLPLLSRTWSSRDRGGLEPATPGCVRAGGSARAPQRLPRPLESSRCTGVWPAGPSVPTPPTGCVPGSSAGRGHGDPTLPRGSWPTARSPRAHFLGSPPGPCAGQRGARGQAQGGLLRAAGGAVLPGKEAGTRLPAVPVEHRVLGDSSRHPTSPADVPPSAVDRAGRGPEQTQRCPRVGLQIHPGSQAVPGQPATSARVRSRLPPAGGAEVPAGTRPLQKLTRVPRHMVQGCIPRKGTPAGLRPPLRSLRPRGPVPWDRRPRRGRALPGEWLCPRLPRGPAPHHPPRALRSDLKTRLAGCGGPGRDGGTEAQRQEGQRDGHHPVVTAAGGGCVTVAFPAGLVASRHQSVTGKPSPGALPPRTLAEAHASWAQPRSCWTGRLWPATGHWGVDVPTEATGVWPCRPRPLGCGCVD